MSPIWDADEEQCGSLVKLILEAFFSNFQNICDGHHAKEVLHVMQVIGLGICICQLHIDSQLTKRFGSHSNKANKVVMFSSTIQDFDDFGKVGQIFSLDAWVCQKKAKWIQD